MKKTISILFIILCGILSSCDEKDGIQDDTIKLSKDKLTFDYTASAQTVTTKGDQWLLGHIRVDGIEISYDLVFTDKEKYYFEYTGEWYHLKRDFKSIEISVDENMTEKSRKLYISMWDRNWYGSSITIVQKEK